MAEPATLMANCPRILIVDDEDDLLKSYALVLQPEVSRRLRDLEAALFGAKAEQGYELTFCTQGEEAVAAVARALDEGQPFSVAFMDVRMPPGITGVEAAERIRALDPDINIVFVTGFSDISPTEFSERVPPADKVYYVVKPFQPAEIQQFALALSEKWKAERSARRSHADLARKNGELADREQDLSVRNMQFHAALDHMAQGIAMFDAEGVLSVCNERYRRLFDLPHDLAVPGATAAAIAAHCEVAGLNYDGLDAGIEHLSLVPGGAPGLYQQRLASGRVIAVAHQRMADGGCVQTFEDVTERLLVQSRIEYLAHHDYLTELPNRALFQDRLETALSRARRTQDGVAILCIDLDRFKRVNDSLGHHVGDALLQEAARRIAACVRESDTVARLGGDEFAVIQLDANQPAAAATLAERILQMLGEPLEVEGHHLTTGASIGIALSEGGESDPSQLLKSADLALYRAKQDGRDMFRFFDASMDARAQEIRKIEDDLRRALALQSFVNYYQPILDLHTQSVVSFEALVRWIDPVRGMIPPGEFIPVAEDTGLIGPLGDWVLERACRDAMAWPLPVKVAVNLSAVQFRLRDLRAVVARILERTGLPASRLVLEITESVLLTGSDGVVEVLSDLRRMGVHIAMDDFGTGHSSLSYLRSFPFDKMKIDRSFVMDLEKSEDAAAIVRAVIGLGNSLHIGVVAEGVETEAQLAYLREQGCDEVQGYLLGRPMPDADVHRLLSAPAPV
ncbi:EAL domain-containing protein [Zavarzinia sp. CC-PAN008]|uniref:EAL domain-containing protein n=1 Tax=Zavarzinia sp. CC-PAN008 TaxID=3243332 RepID=UPI003F7445A4